MQCCYFACMTSITIRNVPDEARDELASRAARMGKSLQEYMLDMIIDTTSRPDLETWMAQVEERTKTVDNSITAEQIVAIIRHDRDSRS